MLRRRLSRCAAVAVAFSLSAGLLPPAAQAQPAPGGAMLLTVNPGERPKPDAERATLTCSPLGGSHPLRAAACAELVRANGDISAVSIDPQRPCHLIYSPVTVTANGRWNGRQISYRETFPNNCVLDVIKGPLFRF
ncbi:SSI family serine proteinase inhibitor [Amycolatopsis nigrescens]|uniref:SSI family serine proteinase inhibitor n=1 Tax=Amycolatopsis nigrescens TaxID=381445 RepID=UPI000A0159D8